jgi:TonB family protein
MFSSRKRLIGFGIAVFLICIPLLSAQSSTNSPGNSSLAKHLGAVDLLSDTKGVDFGPYLKTVIGSVKQNWYKALPENPVSTKGNVSVEFVILKGGRVVKIHRTEISGSAVLDKSAWDAITASNPFPPLPSEFTGTSLALRLHFYYNPDGSDILNQK